MKLGFALIALLAAGCGQATPVDDAECVVDQDCVLMPYVTCCGECPPEPPFEAAPRQALDAVLIEMETQCALERRACEPPVCKARPPGCYVRAACEQGRCVAETDGCDAISGSMGSTR